MFYNILQVQKLKRDKIYTCILAIDFSLTCLEDVYNLLIKSILDYPVINNVKLIPKTIPPIFTSGYASGIVVDVGNIFTNIIPINKGFPLIEKSQQLNMGSSELLRKLKLFLIEDNYILNLSKTKIREPENFVKNVDKYLDDILVRSVFIVNKKLSFEINNDNEQSIGLKNDISKIDFCKGVQDFMVN
jgi:actin-related protein